MQGNLLPHIREVANGCLLFISNNGLFRVYFDFIIYRFESTYHMKSLLSG